MKEPLRLQRLVFLNENILNPDCHACGKELSGFLITQEQLAEYFSPADIGWLVQKKLLLQSKKYQPKLVVFLCKHCCKEKKND